MKNSKLPNKGEMNMSDYETTVRSNESIRDKMDGTMNEPQKTQSTENHNCNCGGNCNNNCKCDHSQSIG